MTEKILLCGATGFIGRNLLERFAKKQECEIVAVYNKKPSGEDKNNIEWVKADLCNPDDVRRVMKGVDVVLQFAATTSGAKDISTKPYIHVTDNAIMNSYIFREAYEQKVKHVIFPSCTVMYQSSETGLKEDDFNGNNEIHSKYFGVGNTKVYLEKMCDFYSRLSDIKFTALRHSNIYGPYDKYDLERSHVFRATMTKVIKAEDKIVVWGSGEEKRDFLHVDDLVNFVELALLKQESNYELFNVGLGKACSIKDLVMSIVKSSGKDLEIEHDLDKPTIKTSLFLDCSKSKEKLGWEPQVSLEEGIERTLKWHRENIR